MAEAALNLRFSRMPPSRDAVTAPDDPLHSFGGLDRSPPLFESDRYTRLITQLVSVSGAIDADGEEPPTPAAVWAANQIIDSLPRWADEPEIDIDGRGGITFEWYRDPTDVIVVTAEGPIIRWAALRGSAVARTSGSAFFTGDLPEDCLRLILRQSQT